MNNNNHNSAKIYTGSTSGELRVSLTNSKQVINATNNKAQYYADMAKTYRDEAKKFSEDAQKNTNVTVNYINEIQTSLDNKINTKQDCGNYALVSDIPENVSELTNDSNYQDAAAVNNKILEYVPPQENCSGRFLMSNGTNTSWVPVTDYTSEFRNIIKSCPRDESSQPDLFSVITTNTEKIYPWTRPNLTGDGTHGGNTYAAFSSGTSAASRQAYKAFDANMSIAWDDSWASQNNSNVHWLCFYSPVPFKCDSITIKNISHDGYNYSCSAGRIEASNDNTNWTVEADFTNNESGSGASWTVNLTNPIYAKYRRFVSTASRYGNLVGVSDMQFNNATQKVSVIAGNTLEFNVSETDPLKIVLPNGKHVKISNSSTLSFEGFTDGHYYLFIDATGLIHIADGYYAQSIKPTNLDSTKKYFWLNTGCIPNKMYKLYNQEETEIQVVHIADVIMEQNLINEIVCQNVPSLDVLNAIAKANPISYVVEKYINGTSWYRVYSDGWCEQGGKLSAKYNGWVNYLKTFKTVLNFGLCLITTRGGASYDKETYPNSVLLTGFSITTLGSTDNSGAFWKAEGFIK